jgi:RNA polymerase sigma-70 factor (ECF subfamily)
MSKVRNNDEWIQDLAGQGLSQAEAIKDLYDLLLGAAVQTFSRSLNDVQILSNEEKLRLAEDCSQDALLSVLDHLGEFRGDSQFTTWAFKFAVNISLSCARRELWKHVPLKALSEDLVIDEWLPNLEKFSPQDPGLPVLKKEIYLAIREAVRQELTLKQRQVLKLVVFDQVPMDVVVQHLGTNRNAVYKLLHDARQKIKKHLITNGFDPEEALILFSKEE